MTEPIAATIETPIFSHDPVKMIVVGESGTGKTGALAGLVDAGYKVRLLDLDNGARIVRNLMQSGRYNRANLKNFSSITFTEKMRPINGRIVPVAATVWSKSMNAISHWRDTDGNDFGDITTWGDDCVLAVDTLSTLGAAAFNHHRAMNGRLQGEVSGNTWRRDIGTAQVYVEDFLKLIFDQTVRCNVVLNTHLTYSKLNGQMPTEEEQAQAARDKHVIELYGFPSAIGKAAGPKMPKYFNDLLYVKLIGNNSMIYTTRMDNIGVKTSAPGIVKPSYPIATGLADYFKAVRGVGK